MHRPFEYGQLVEFTGTSSCRVLVPDQRQFPSTPRWFCVRKGDNGIVRTSGNVQTLPGDIAVEVFDFERECHMIVAVREGLLAAFSIEEDPDTGRPAFKRFRNAVVPIEHDD